MADDATFASDNSTHAFVRPRQSEIDALKAEDAAMKAAASQTPPKVSTWYNWIKEWGMGRVQQLCVSAVKTRPVPRHIAFIMDGNRRFAKKMKVQTTAGHALGFETLKTILESCMDLGVKIVTVYAFSIENFKRTAEEVDFLMNLAKEKFSQMLERSDIIEKHGIRIRILGDIALLPPDVQRVVGRAVTLSAKNTNAILNVCFAYTSRQEIASAISDIRDGVVQGLIHDSDISESLIEKCLYTEDTPPPELVVRTSGEVRLSDFLLWQSNFSCMSFIEVLWPEFETHHLLQCILTYQANHAQLQSQYLHHLEERQLRQEQDDLDAIKRSSSQTALSPEQILALLPIYAKEREARVQQFLEGLYRKREAYFRSLAPYI